jgi:deoxyribonuclease V
MMVLMARAGNVPALDFTSAAFCDRLFATLRSDESLVTASSGPVSIEKPHPWDITPREAAALQEELRHKVVRRDELGEVSNVAGIDVGFEQSGSLTRAAVALLGLPGLQLVQSAIARLPTRFPYVPGLLSFREIPAVLEALRGLSVPPDLILYDGQGIAHPRRFGIASHLGLLSGIPTIGVAKTRLIGQHDEVPKERGGWTPLIDKGEVIGAVVRTRSGVRPLYVSIGHRISLATAIGWVISCTPRYRLPETTRWAHRLASGPAPPRSESQYSVERPADQVLTGKSR